MWWTKMSTNKRKDEYNYYDEHDMKLYDEYYDSSEDRKVLDRGCKDDDEYCDEYSDLFDLIAKYPNLYACGSFGFNLENDCRKSCGYC